VGDHDQCGAGADDGGAQPLLDLGAGDGVERAEGFVGQQYRLVGEQRAGQRGALPHASRQGGGAFLLPVREPPLVQGGVRPGPGRLTLHAAVAQADRDIVEQIQPGQQRVTLRHDGAAGQSSGRIVVAENADRTGGGLVQTGDQREQRGLAAARASDQGDMLTYRHLQLQPAEDVAIGLRIAVAEAGDSDRGR